MGNPEFDVIVVGARCAGSPTARLLAREGLHVLVVDRARFPSDTLSTHCIATPGCVQLQRWGLWDRVLATNVPHVSDILLSFRGLELGSPPQVPGMPGTVSPRRTVLDKLLLDAAVEAGAEAREGISVKQLTTDAEGRVTGIVGREADGGRFEATASLVVGADGVHSFVAEQVAADEYDVRASYGAGFYAYFSGWPAVRVELAFGDEGGVGVFPTNDEQVCIFGGKHMDAFGDYKRDVEATFTALLGHVNPRFGEWIAGTARESRFHAWTAIPGRFRKPYGPGWALVGDAGYYKDPVTGHGITDAFRDAELLANATVAALGGGMPAVDAFADYQLRRDEMARDLYHATQDLAAFAAPDAELADAFIRFGAAIQKEVLEMAAF